MDYGSFTLYCFNQGINPSIITACEPAVIEDNYVLNGREISPTSSLGYAELTDIDTVEKGIDAIKDSIYMSTFDFDKLGRNIEKMRTKQLIKDPHKALTRIVLKTFYLLGGRA